VAFRHQERSFRSDATVLADYALTTTTTTRGGGENGREGKGREERGGERRGRRRRKKGACTHWNFRKSAPMGVHSKLAMWATCPKVQCINELLKKMIACKMSFVFFSHINHVCLIKHKWINETENYVTHYHFGFLDTYIA